MNENELRGLLANGENTRVEFKFRMLDRNGLENIICSMANTEGGVIIFGVNDSGAVIGLKRDESYLKIIKDITSEKIRPSISVECDFKEIEKNLIFYVTVPKSSNIHYNSNGDFCRRINDKTYISPITTTSDGSRIFSQSATLSYIEEFNVPNRMHPGEERIKNALTLKAHDKTLRVTFLWGDNLVKVIGAHMIQENVFEFPPDKEKREWYLKFSIDPKLKVNCDKQVYINVEEIIQEKFKYYCLTFFTYFLIAISFIPLLKGFISEKSIFTLTISGAYSIPIPIITIISFILLSNRISIAIQRFSNIKMGTNVKFSEKAITDPNNIQLKTIHIREKEKNDNNF